MSRRTGEKVCLDCGEVVTANEKFCPRCRGNETNSFALSGLNLILASTFLTDDNEYAEESVFFSFGISRLQARIEARRFKRWLTRRSKCEVLVALPL